MKKVEDFHEGKRKEVGLKYAREKSLKACMAKAKGWTLKKGESPPIHEASINKMTWFYVRFVPNEMAIIFHITTRLHGVHVILKTITRTRTLKGGGFGLIPILTTVFSHKSYTGKKTSEASLSLHLRSDQPDPAS